MNIGSIVAGALSPLISFADGLVHSGEEKAEAQQKLQELAQAVIQDVSAHVTATIEAQRDVIVAEAKGHSWLQRNWRPITALWFAGLIGAHWLGFTAPNLTEPVILSLLGLVKIMIGGYVGSRGIEKIAVPIVHAVRGKPE